MKDYYLNLEKLNTLSEYNSKVIMDMYKDMLNFQDMGNMTSATSFFNTLEMYGFIKNRTTEERKQKLEGLIDG